MPASQTITAFYSFTAMTVIKSAEVNNNFSLIRGHWLPIDGSAASFAHQSYDLGSSTYNWRGIYQQYGIYSQYSTFTTSVPTGTCALYFKDNGGLYKKTQAGVETELGSGGAGAGIFWNDAGPSAPFKTTENNQIVYEFEAGLTQSLYWQFRLPTSYGVGKQVSLKVSFYSTSTTNAVQFRTVTTLIRSGTDQVSSTATQYTSTAAAVNNPGTANVYNTATLDLSDSSGLLAGVTLSAGDLLFVQLYRASDTDTATVKLLPFAAEPIIA